MKKAKTEGHAQRKRITENKNIEQEKNKNQEEKGKNQNHKIMPFGRACLGFTSQRDAEGNYSHKEKLHKRE